MAAVLPGTGVMVRLCFVCLGNICRSPTAEAVMFDLVDKAGLGAVVEVDSAGTAGYHAGEQPDARAAAAARRRGVQLRGRARQFRAKDYDRFDYVLAMDQSNFDDLMDLAASPDARKKLHLLRSFDPESPKGASVPDPYYGGDDGFEQVLDICTSACSGLLERVKKEHGL
jgi:protein-tyrosine phosphatase